MRKIVIGVFCCALIVLLVGQLGLWGSLPFLKRTLPNFVFVTIDTLRADHLHCYGYSREVSPFIDSIAERGVLFKNAFSASSHTAPSHASMFTSLFPFEHKMLRNHETMDPALFNFFTFFDDIGYQVAGLPSVAFLEGKAGFPLIEFPETDEEKDRMRRYRFRSAEIMVDRALAWMKRQDHEKPIFLWLHFYDVHQWQGSGQLPPEYLERVKSLPRDSYLDFLQKRHNTPIDFFGGPQGTLEAMDGYDARLMFVDEQLGRLYREMSGRGLQKDTYWIVLSDHGEGLGNHNYAGHGEFLYNEQLHIPLIFHHSAGDLKGKQVERLVRTVDLFPTLAAIVGESLEGYVPKGQGVSLLSLLRSDSWNQGKEFDVRFSYAERRPKDNRSHRKLWKDEEVFSLHDLENKLIYHSVEEDEFFDIRSDPFETKNIGPEGRSEQDSMLKSLQSLIADRDKNASMVDNEPEITPDEVKELTTLGYM